MDPEAIQLLREIRDEARKTNSRLDQTNSRLDQTNSRLDQTNSRLDQLSVGVDQTNARLEVVETTVLELAEQQRFVVRYLRTLSEREHRLDDDVGELRRRVEKLEKHLDPR